MGVTTNDSANSTTEAFTCFTCDLVNQYHAQSGDFIESVSAIMLPPMWSLFVAICGVWIVIQGIKLATNQTDPLQIGKDFFFIIIAGALLATESQGLIKTVFDTAITIMGEAASVVLQNAIDAAKFPPEIAGLGRLSAVAEEGMMKVVRIAIAIASSWSVTNPLQILYALILLLPYFIMLVIYLSQTVIAVFRVMVIAAFGPFLVLAFGFGWGRNMTASGLRTLLSSVIVLFSASLALGSIMYGVAQLNILEPDVEVAELAQFSDKAFFIAVVLGWMGSAFMTEAVGIANSITGSALSNTSAGVMTAGIVSSAAAVAAKAHPGLRVAGAVLGGVTDAKGTAASTVASAENVGKKFEAFKNGQAASFSDRVNQARSKYNS